MAIDLSKVSLGFAAYYGYSKKSNPGWSDEKQLENWNRSKSFDWKEMWECAARQAIEENKRREGCEADLSDLSPPAKPNIDFSAITKACST